LEGENGVAEMTKLELDGCHLKFGVNRSDGVTVDACGQCYKTFYGRK
jgi:hypothetical protein